MPFILPSFIFLKVTLQFAKTRLPERSIPFQPSSQVELMMHKQQTMSLDNALEVVDKRKRLDISAILG
jgi:hypothetical protein